MSQTVGVCPIIYGLLVETPAPFVLVVSLGKTITSMCKLVND